MEFKHRAVLVHNLIYFPFSPSSPPPTSQIEGVQTVRLNPVPDGQVLPEELTVFSTRFTAYFSDKTTLFFLSFATFSLFCCCRPLTFLLHMKPDRRGNVFFFSKEPFDDMVVSCLEGGKMFCKTDVVISQFCVLWVCKGGCVGVLIDPGLMLIIRLCNACVIDLRVYTRHQCLVVVSIDAWCVVECYCLGFHDALFALFRKRTRVLWAHPVPPSRSS